MVKQFYFDHRNKLQDTAQTLWNFDFLVWYNNHHLMINIDKNNIFPYTPSRGFPETFII